MTSGLQPIFSGAPTPVAGVTGGPGLPVGVAGIDGTTGNIQISAPSNTTQFKKGTTPQVLQVYEYFNSNTDFARISLNAQTNGPFQLAVEVAPPGVLRDLVVIATQNVYVNANQLLPIANNQVSLGNATFKWSNIFAATAMQTPQLQFTSSGTAVNQFGGTGAPPAGLGANGDIYIRSDGGSLTTIYQKRGGAWVGIV